MHVRATDLAEWLRDRVTAAAARGLVVGLGGDLGSAAIAGLCRMAMPERVAGVILPCHGDAARETDARAVATHFGIPVARVGLDAVFDQLTMDLTAAVAGLRAGQPLRSADDADEHRPQPLAALTPRLRMACLYFVADSLEYLVAGTLNRSDLTVGAFTKFGDAAVDVLPLGDLMRSEARALAADVGVPQEMLDRLAIAEPPRAHEGAPAIRHSDLERYLANGPEAVAPALGLRIERLVRASDRMLARPATPAGGEKGKDAE